MNEQSNDGTVTEAGFIAYLAAKIEQQQLYCEYRKVPTERLAKLLNEEIRTHVAAEVKRAVEGCAINTNVRLFDLVRQCRSELHQQDLITDEEYAWLSGGSPMAHAKEGGSPSPRRLEDYDALKRETEALRSELAEAVRAIDKGFAELGTVKDWLATPKEDLLANAIRALRTERSKLIEECAEIPALRAARDGLLAENKRLEAERDLMSEGVDMLHAVRNELATAKAENERFQRLYDIANENENTSNAELLFARQELAATQASVQELVGALNAALCEMIDGTHDGMLRGKRVIEDAIAGHGGKELL